MIPSEDVYSSGSWFGKIIYLEPNKTQYLVLKNRNVYKFRDAIKKNAFLELEFGRIYKKIGIVNDVKELEKSISHINKTYQIELVHHIVVEK